TGGAGAGAAAGFRVCGAGLLVVCAAGSTVAIASRAANTFPLAVGPHPQRVLTVMPRLGYELGPRLGMAAGATFFSIIADACIAGRDALAKSRNGASQLDQLEELHPRPRVRSECAEHGAGDGERILFLDTAHRHA